MSGRQSDPRPDLRLIVITDAALASPRPVLEVVAAALAAGAPAVQLRDKAASARDLFRQAVELRELTRDHGAFLFVNDRLDVALAAGADGVHLGPLDLPVSTARRMVDRARGLDPTSPLDSRFLVGFSTDDPAAARTAETDGADYIGCGAVFGTTSKPEAEGERIGTDRLAAVAAAVAIPVVGIGGVTPDSAPLLRLAGAAGAAVIGAVMAAADPAAATKRLLAAFPAPPDA